jgi:hypothetical protein
MPLSIPAGMTRTHVLQALADLDAGLDHPFGQPTGYELLHEGKRYPLKAVVGLACRYSLGRVLLPEEFSGGEAPGQANFVLRKLGFTIVRKGESETVQDTDAARDWTEQEVRLIVADYFAMLEAELQGGELYKKSEHRKALIPLLGGRSDGSVEFKHQNISSVLVELGLPYVEGYKPRGNYQGLLATEVESFLDQRPGFLEQLAAAPTLNPNSIQQPPSLDLSQINVDPPEKIIAPSRTGKPWLSRRGKRIDFAEKNAADRRLGKLGEEFVYDLERHRNKDAGRDDLALKVQWVAQTIGDGLGFDILSFDEADDSERMLEVKATGLGKFFPFYVTANEVRCSDDIPDKFHLFRVFNMGREPQIYILHGSLKILCQLEPILFRAVI